MMVESENNISQSHFLENSAVYEFLRGIDITF